MRIQSSRRVRIGVALGAIGIALIATVYAFAGGPETSATVQVCIKPNGQLRAVTDANPTCSEPEKPADWTVNGVKDVRPGPGLSGTSTNGVVDLQVDPGLIEAANSGKIYAGFDDGPHPIPDGSLDSLSAVAQLAVPAGSYAIFAKLNLIDFSGREQYAPVWCRLSAGGDFDEAAELIEGLSLDGGMPEGTYQDVLGLEVVHHFGSRSRILLSCADGFPPLGGHVSYQDLKIIAVRSSGISNVFLGG